MHAARHSVTSELYIVFVRAVSNNILLAYSGKLNDGYRCNQSLKIVLILKFSTYPYILVSFWRPILHAPPGPSPPIPLHPPPHLSRHREGSLNPCSPNSTLESQ